MKRPRLLSLALLPVALAAGAFLTSPLFAQERSDAAILGALRISSLEDLASSAGAFAEQIQPGSGAATAQLTGAAAAFGIATDQEVLALLLDPQTSAQPFALVLPATDPEQLKANPAIGFQALATSPERYQITLPNGLPMFATFVGSRIVVSPQEAGLDAVLPAIQAGDDIRQLRAAGGQIALSLSADRIYAAYKPMLDLMLMGMRSQLAAATTNPGAATANPADILGWLLGPLADVEDYSLRIALHADHLDLRGTIAARPGTSTASLLNAGRGPAVGIPASFDPLSVVFCTISTRPGPEFWAAYNQLFTEFFSSLSPSDPAPDSTAMLDAINRFTAIWDGTMSMAFLSSAPGMNGVSSMGITDREKAIAFIRELPELQKSMAAVNAAQGLATDLSFGGEETHGDALLIDITQTYRAISPEMEESLKALQRLGMETFTATYAVAPSRLISVMGEDSRSKTKRLLDAPETASTDITPAAYGLPAESTFFVAMSLPRYLGWVSRAGAIPLPFDASVAPAKPGFAFTADLIDGRADFRVHLATSEIIALRSGLTQPAAAPSAQAEGEPSP